MALVDADGRLRQHRAVEPGRAVDAVGHLGLAYEWPLRTGGERHAGDPRDRRYRQCVAGHLPDRLVAVHRGDGHQVDLGITVGEKEGDGVVVTGIAVEDDLGRHGRTIYKNEVHIGTIPI